MIKMLVMFEGQCLQNQIKWYTVSYPWRLLINFERRLRLSHGRNFSDSFSDQSVFPGGKT